MPDRTVRVTLTASIQQYVAGMEQAALKTRTVGTEAQKLAAQRQGITDIGHVLLGIGTLAAVGVGLAIKSFADFDAKMSQVKTLSGATADEMNALSDAALHLGQQIGFTANDVADAEIELVKAGVSVKDQLGGALQGALQLAAAGQIDVAQATEIATIAMTQFALKGRDVPHVADLLAAGADKALGSVGDLGEALKSGGLVASQFGVSLDETVGTLSAFANAGLIGETAGTDLRQMLLKLAAPAADAQKVMGDLGISIYDQGGKFVGLSNLAGQLKDKLSGVSEETRNADLATIFGSRAIAGANVLYKEGAKGIADWTSEVNDSGFAAKQAAGKMDNLNGDVSKLQAAFQTALIESGSNANNVLREMTKVATGLLTALGDLPEPVMGVGLGLTSVVAVIGLVGGGLVTAIPKFAAFKQGLDSLQLSLKGTALAAGGITAGLSLGLAIIGIWADKVAKDQAAADAFRDSLDQTTGALTKYSRSLVVADLQSRNLYDAAKKAGITQAELTDAIISGGGALDDVKAKLLEYSKTLGGTEGKAANAGSAVSLLGESVDGARQAVVKGTEEFKNNQAAMADGTPVTKSAADAYKDAASQAAALESDLSQLIDTINKANGVGQDAVSTNAAYKSTLDDVEKKVKSLKGGIDESTSAGAENAAMLADLAKKNEDAAAAAYALDGNTDSYVATLTAGHQAVYDNARALGATADQAQALADKVAAIPSQKDVYVLVNTKDATAALNQLFNIAGPSVVTVTPGSKRKGFATGGYTGDGSSTDIAGAVHKREFVLDAKATANPNNRAAAQFMLSGGDISKYQSGRNYSPGTTYSGAPARGAGGLTINVGAPIINAGAIADQSAVAKMVIRAVQDAVKLGDVPRNWNG
jgi:TP901 family phage tail tape measure protein